MYQNLPPFQKFFVKFSLCHDSSINFQVVFLWISQVPRGAVWYLQRVYGEDWNITVRPHNWASQHGEGFEATDAPWHRQIGTEGGGRWICADLPVEGMGWMVIISIYY